MPQTTLVPVNAIEGGLFCRDLAAKGYGYAEAVEYWELEASPDRMDADNNGIPCQTVYAESDVMAVWGDPLPTVPENVFAFLREADVGPPRMLTADYAQWFWGEDETHKACLEDGRAEDDCPGEGLYYIRNVNPRLRTIPVSESALIVVGDWHDWHAYGGTDGYECIDAAPEIRADAGLDEHPTWGCIVTFHDLQSAITGYMTVGGPGLIAWLVIEDGVIAALEEQYVP
jgi:hypothetical protein